MAPTAGMPETCQNIPRDTANLPGILGDLVHHMELESSGECGVERNLMVGSLNYSTARDLIARIGWIR